MDLLAIGVSVAAPAIVGLVTFHGARKLGLTQAQQSLVSTLKDTVAAQEDRIEQLERVETDCKIRLGQHAARIASLESAMGEINRENHRLHRQLDQWEDATPLRKPPRRPRRGDPA